MFHTLSELHEKEKNKGKQKPKKSILNMSKERSPQDNYYGKGNKAYDHYNKRPSESLSEKFEKTKNKIKLIVFKNGFILNNGPFRNRAIPENNKFMEEVERGNIPHELMNKGIDDLGILLINRKKEIYYQPNKTIVPNNHLVQITQIKPVNPITINPIEPIDNISNSYNNYNQFINFDFNQFNKNQLSPTNSYNKINNNFFNNNYFNLNNNNIYNSYTYNKNVNNNSYKYNNYSQKKQKKTHRVNQFGHYEFNDPLFVNIDTLENNDKNIPIQTPVGNRNIRKDIFIKKFPNTERRDYNRFERYSSGIPMTNVQNNFGLPNSFENYEFIQGEKEEYNQEQIFNNNNNFNDINNYNNIINEKIEEVNEENIDTGFNYFGENGQSFNNINTEGVTAQRDLQNDIDILKPSCLIYVRLYNGEIVKARFNYSQTLLDIYLYVKRISGFENFSLFRGESFEPFVNYELTIGDLKLENETITQSLNS